MPVQRNVRRVPVGSETRLLDRALVWRSQRSARGFSGGLDFKAPDGNGRDAFGGPRRSIAFRSGQEVYSRFHGRVQGAGDDLASPDAYVRIAGHATGKH